MKNSGKKKLSSGIKSVVIFGLVQTMIYHSGGEVAACCVFLAHCDMFPLLTDQIFSFCFHFSLCLFHFALEKILIWHMEHKDH